MNKVIAILMGIIMIFVVMSVGCVEEAPTEDLETTTSVPTPDSTPKSTTPPTKVADKYYSAWNYEDYDQMYSLLSENCKGTSFEDWRIKVRRMKSTAFEGYMYLDSYDEKITGDEAVVTVEVELPGGYPTRKTVNLVRESGEWKINSGWWAYCG